MLSKRIMLIKRKMNDMITCDRNAPSTRLTIPVSRYPNIWFADSLPRLRNRWYICSVSTRDSRYVGNSADSGSDCSIGLIFCLQPLCRHILRGFLFLLWLWRWNFTQDYHAGLTAVVLLATTTMYNQKSLVLNLLQFFGLAWESHTQHPSFSPRSSVRFFHPVESSIHRDVCRSTGKDCTSSTRAR